MAFRYSPEAIRRMKEIGAFDPGLSLLPITGWERTRLKSAWGVEDDEEAESDATSQA